MNHPDFIIVGAPKSGTTSLWGYLSQHPDVFITAKKEPMFFCGYQQCFNGPLSEGYNRSMVVDEDEYRALFAAAQDGQLTGEASTDYLSCPEATDRIYESNPATKIIMVLRNPIQRAFSEHQHLLRDQHEDLDFMAALQCEAQRIEDGFVPLFWHVKRGLYADAVHRYLDRFGRGQVKIFLFDDLVVNPQQVYQDLLAFLGLSDEVKVDLKRKWNVSGVPKSRFLQRLYLAWNRTGKKARWKRVMQGLVPSRNLRQTIREFFLKANLDKGERCSREAYSFLLEIFRDDIYQLEKIIGRDLAGWIEVNEKGIK